MLRLNFSSWISRHSNIHFSVSGIVWCWNATHRLMFWIGIPQLMHYFERVWKHWEMGGLRRKKWVSGGCGTHDSYSAQQSAALSQLTLCVATDGITLLSSHWAPTTLCFLPQCNFTHCCVPQWWFPFNTQPETSMAELEMTASLQEWGLPIVLVIPRAR